MIHTINYFPQSLTFPLQVGDVGCVVWDAALVLAYYIQTSQANAEFISNRSILELGSGTGIVGMVSAACGAKHVVLTDLPELIPLLNHNIEANQNWLCKKIPNNLGTQCSVVACPYKWGENDVTKLPRKNLLDENSHNFSSILVADCVYYEEAVKPLASTINHLIRSGSENVSVLCSYEDREIGDKDKLQINFKHLLSEEFKLKIEYISFEDMYPEYRSPDIHIMRITK